MARLICRPSLAPWSGGRGAAGAPLAVRRLEDQPPDLHVRAHGLGQGDPERVGTGRRTLDIHAGLRRLDRRQNKACSSDTRCRHREACVPFRHRHHAAHAELRRPAHLQGFALVAGGGVDPDPIVDCPATPTSPAALRSRPVTPEAKVSPALPSPNWPYTPMPFSVTP